MCQSRLGFSSWSAVPNQTKPGRCFGFKQANCFENNISVLKGKHISSEISTRTQKPLTLPCRKSNTGGEQKLTQYLLTKEDMTRISTVNRFLTKRDIFSTTLGGDQYVTSSVLLPVIAPQAPRQSVCSAGWVSCRTRGGSACLVVIASSCSSS